VKVRIGETATEDEAAAIAAALATHVDGEIEVYVGDETEPTVSRSPGIDAGHGESMGDEDDLGPTEREQRLR